MTLVARTIAHARRNRPAPIPPARRLHGWALTGAIQRRGHTRPVLRMAPRPRPVALIDERRAFLLASLDRPVTAPPPTHSRTPGATLFGTLRPWVSMAEALGFDGTHGRTVGFPRRAWVWDRPATTIAGDPRITARCHHEGGSQGADAKTTRQVLGGDYQGTEPIRLTLAEALALQSFPVDYPVQGNKTAAFRQVGDAVPPLLAAHVLAAVTGRALEAAA